MTDLSYTSYYTASTVWVTNKRRLTKNAIKYDQSASIVLVKAVGIASMVHPMDDVREC